LRAARVPLRSYTYNLYHLIAAVNGGARCCGIAASADARSHECAAVRRAAAVEPPVVVYNDEVNWDEMERVLAAGSFDSGACAAVRCWRDAARLR
jgi:hypothetical protein